MRFFWSIRPLAFLFGLVVSAHPQPLVGQLPDGSLRDSREIHLKNIRQLTTSGENAEAYFSDDGTRLIFQARGQGEGCDQIFTLDLATGATEMVNQIDQASEHMNLGAEEISKNLEVISTVTNQSASSADRMASSAERLSNQTEALRGLVGRFQLNAPDSHESADVGDEKPRYHIPGMCHPERMEVEIQNS